MAYIDVDPISMFRWQEANDEMRIRALLRHRRMSRHTPAFIAHVGKRRNRKAFRAFGDAATACASAMREFAGVINRMAETKDYFVCVPPKDPPCASN